jgi:hypothetical protein
MTGAPECTHPNAKCMDSRRRAEFRWRRYHCPDCGERWTTAEVRINAKGPGSNAIEILRSELGVSEFALTERQYLAIIDLVESFIER